MRAREHMRLSNTEFGFAPFPSLPRPGPDRADATDLASQADADDLEPGTDRTAQDPPAAP